MNGVLNEPVDMSHRFSIYVLVNPYNDIAGKTEAHFTEVNVGNTIDVFSLAHKEARSTCEQYCILAFLIQWGLRNQEWSYASS